jgi:predicted transcriptional regulator
MFMTKKKSVYIRLEPEYIEKIDQMAKKEDRSRSYIIRRLIISTFQ